MSSLIEILKMLVSCPSVTEDRESCKKILTQVASGISDAQQDQSKGMLWWGHTDLATTRWLINTHVDVVPGQPEQFSLRISGDKVWGRGVADVKGCAAILINQAENWTKIAEKKKITFMLVTDEEIGGTSTKEILPLMTGLEGAIFLEPTTLHITTQAKGIMQIKITAKGTSCHGSRPWDGENAIEILANCLAQFRKNNPSPVQETRDATFNFSQINGGQAINQVPGTADLWCDVRFHPQDNPTQIIRTIKTCFKTCSVVTIRCESPINCDKNSTIFTTLSASLKANSINPLSHFDHGTSDARHATALDIPALVFGPKGGGLHSNNEWVSIKSLDKVSNTLDHWIKNI